MNAVVRNGCCEIRGGAGKPRVTLPPMNIDEAILHRDHVAVVLRNGYCQLYNTEGKLVTTYIMYFCRYWMTVISRTPRDARSASRTLC